MARNYLSGITLQIGGDTSPLSKALKEPNKEANELQSSLKAINQALKLDPTNTDLLRQKQDLLGQSIENNEERLKLLKTAQQQFVESGGNVTDRSYIELERQIAITENQIKKAKDQQNSFTESLQAFGVAAKDIGTKAESLGTKLLPVTGAVAAIGTAATKTAIDFEDAMSQLAGALNEPIENMGELRELAIQTGQDTIFSASEAASAMVELAKGGLTEAQIQGGALATTMDLAASSQMDLATSANVVVQAMGAFHIEADQSAIAANALAGAAAASSTDVQPLTEALSQCSAQAYNANWSIQETTAALALFADSGIRGSDAGTSLKTMLQRLAAPTDEAAKQIEKLGIETRDTDGHMLGLQEVADQLHDKLGNLSDAERDAALQTIFGSDAMRAATILMNSGSEGLERYVEATNDQESAQRLANSQMSDWSRSLEELQGSLETAAIIIGEKLAPYVSDLADGISDLIGWFSDLDPAVQDVIIGVTGLTAAAGPALIVFGKAAKGLDSLITAGGKLGTTLGNLSKSTGLASDATSLFSKANEMLGGHLGLVVTAAVALPVLVAEITAALTDGQNYVFDYADAIKEMKTSLDEIETTKEQAIITAQNEAIEYQNLKGQLDQMVDSNGKVKEGYEQMAGVIVNELNSALGTHMEIVNGAIQGYQQASEEIDKLIVKMQAQAVLEAQKEALDQAVQIKNDNLKQISEINTQLEAEQQRYNERMNMLRQKGLSDQQIYSDSGILTLQATITTYQDQMDELVEINAGITEDQATYYNNMALMQEGSLESLKKINQSEIAEYDEQGNRIIPTLKERYAQQLAEVNTYYAALKNTTDDGERKIIQAQIDSAKEKLEQIKKDMEAQGIAIKEGEPGIISAWESVAEGSVDAVSDYNSFYTAGQNAASGYNNGLNSYMGYIEDTARKLANKGITAIKNALQIKSPSHVMRDEVGKNIDAGIGVGIEKNADLAIDPLIALAKKIKGVEISQNVSGQIEKTIRANNVITVNSPIEIDLDGKPIYQNVVKRITKTQGIRSQFKGAY